MKHDQNDNKLLKQTLIKTEGSTVLWNVKSANDNIMYIPPLTEFHKQWCEDNNIDKSVMSLVLGKPVVWEKGQKFNPAQLKFFAMTNEPSGVLLVDGETRLPIFVGKFRTSDAVCLIKLLMNYTNSEAEIFLKLSTL